MKIEFSNGVEVPFSAVPKATIELPFSTLQNIAAVAQSKGLRKDCVARLIVEDGETWLRVCPPSGREYDEPISGWVLVHTLCSFERPEFPDYYEHKDGRMIPAVF